MDQLGAVGKTEKADGEEQGVLQISPVLSHV